MANAARQGWRGTLCKHCPAEPGQGRMLGLSNISQNVLPTANALKPTNPDKQFHPSDPADGFVFDKLVFFC